MSKRQCRPLTSDQVALMQRLIDHRPRLTNEQIAQLVGCSDSTIAAERSGTRNPITKARQEAFEALKASLGLPNAEQPPPPTADATASDDAMIVKATLALEIVRAMLPAGSESTIEDQATRFMKLTNADLVATYKALATEDVDAEDMPAPPDEELLTHEQRAARLATEIRIQALTTLRKQLTNGEIQPDDALAVLGGQ